MSVNLASFETSQAPKGWGRDLHPYNVFRSSGLQGKKAERKSFDAPEVKLHPPSFFSQRGQLLECGSASAGKNDVFVFFFGRGRTRS